MAPILKSQGGSSTAKSVTRAKSSGVAIGIVGTHGHQREPPFSTILHTSAVDLTLTDS